MIGPTDDASRRRLTGRGDRRDRSGALRAWARPAPSVSGVPAQARRAAATRRHAADVVLVSVRQHERRHAAWPAKCVRSGTMRSTPRQVGAGKHHAWRRSTMVVSPQETAIMFMPNSPSPAEAATTSDRAPLIPGIRVPSRPVTAPAATTRLPAALVRDSRHRAIGRPNCAGRASAHLGTRRPLGQPDRVLNGRKNRRKLGSTEVGGTRDVQIGRQRRRGRREPARQIEQLLDRERFGATRPTPGR